jgi:hypothetical protein
MKQSLTPTQRRWAERVAKWEESKLGREEFAAKEGVVAEQLTWWRWKLRRMGVAPLEVVAAAPGPSFVRLEAAPAPSRRAAQSEPLELILGSGQTVRIPVGFDPETLSRVMTLLSRGET